MGDEGVSGFDRFAHGAAGVEAGDFGCGPGANRFNGFLDNTEVFHAIIDAIGLDARQ